MNRPLATLALLALALAARPHAPSPPGKSLPVAMAPVAATAPKLAVHFSPNGGCEQEWVARIGGAQKSLRVAAYSFTSRPIADALIAAHARGVDVAVVLDSGNRTDKYSRMAAVVAAGIPVAVDATHKIMHNKFGVFDGSIVLTGSFNLSASANHANAENLITIRDATLAAAYAANWAAHRSHSEMQR
jgi:phosphatidylserine/phosphatidylglycerophosphate/cardiolipin synthase-like enzyme